MAQLRVNFHNKQPLFVIIQSTTRSEILVSSGQAAGLVFCFFFFFALHGGSSQDPY